MLTAAPRSRHPRSAVTTPLRGIPDAGATKNRRHFDDVARHQHRRSPRRLRAARPSSGCRRVERLSGPHPRARNSQLRSRWRGGHPVRPALGVRLPPRCRADERRSRANRVTDRPDPLRPALESQARPERGPPQPRRGHAPSRLPGVSAAQALERRPTMFRPPRRRPCSAVAFDALLAAGCPSRDRHGRHRSRSPPAGRPGQADCRAPGGHTPSHSSIFRAPCCHTSQLGGKYPDCAGIRRRLLQKNRL